MGNSNPSDIYPIANLPIKKLLTIGKVSMVTIDQTIIKRLGLSEDKTMFQEEVVEGGIFLRILGED